VEEDIYLNKHPTVYTTVRLICSALTRFRRLEISGRHRLAIGKKSVCFRATTPDASKRRIEGDQRRETQVHNRSLHRLRSSSHRFSRRKARARHGSYHSTGDTKVGRSRESIAGLSRPQEALGTQWSVESAIPALHAIILRRLHLCYNTTDQRLNAWKYLRWVCFAGAGGTHGRLYPSHF